MFSNNDSYFRISDFVDFMLAAGCLLNLLVYAHSQDNLSLYYQYCPDDHVLYSEQVFLIFSELEAGDLSW